MPIKINLVINRGHYNQVQHPNITINQGASRNSAPQSQPPLPPGISMRRAINAPKTGCKSCRG